MAKAITYWEKHLENLAPGTRANYSHRFNSFLSFTGLSAEEIYTSQRAFEDDNDRDPRDPSEVVDRVVDYLKHLETREINPYRPGTIKGVVAALTVFFQVNKCSGFEIPKTAVPYADSDGARAITKTQARVGLSHVGHEFEQRNTALIMFSKDAGLRIGDMAALVVSEYLDSEEYSPGFRRWQRGVLTHKRKRIAHVHIGPDAVAALDQYIDFREKTAGTTYKIPYGAREEVRHRPDYSPDQSLFLGRAGRPMSADAIGTQLKRLCRYTDVAKVSAHSFRKFHKTRLEAAGMPEQWIKKLQGKSTDTYSRPEHSDPEKTGDLSARYVECYFELSLAADPPAGVLEVQQQLQDQRAHFESVMDGKDERLAQLEEKIQLIMRNAGMLEDEPERGEP